mmetsp:Transcript_122619/g.318837  ORF Transcript_122619/g.318837 Transcript_122619/m.318837 type:complete len:269 (+) Transcript_122619:14-820(+)
MALRSPSAMAVPRHSAATAGWPRPGKQSPPSGGCPKWQPAAGGVAHRFAWFATPLILPSTQSLSPKYAPLRPSAWSGIKMGFMRLFSLYTRGTAVGMFKPMILSSGTLSRYLTSARSEFPCAAMITFLPDLRAGATVLFQKGSTRSIVIFRDSVKGSSFLERPAYFASNLGWYGLSSAITGGGTENDLRHCVTCSSPNFAVASALLAPCKSPYIRSLSFQDFCTGIQSESISSRAKAKVLMARFWTEVKAMSTVMLASFINWPAYFAS